MQLDMKTSKQKWERGASGSRSRYHAWNGKIPTLGSKSLALSQTRTHPFCRKWSESSLREVTHLRYVCGRNTFCLTAPHKNKVVPLLTTGGAPRITAVRAQRDHFLFGVQNTKLQQSNILCTLIFPTQSRERGRKKNGPIKMSEGQIYTFHFCQQKTLFERVTSVEFLSEGGAREAPLVRCTTEGKLDYFSLFCFICLRWSV